MINKIFYSFDEAIADIPDKASVMLGSFAGPGGVPLNLIKALNKKKGKDLTLIVTNGGSIEGTFSCPDQKILFESRHVKKLITTYLIPRPKQFGTVEKQVIAGEIEVELIPLGTFLERIKAGGSGIGAFYTPLGVGTLMEKGKEKRVIGGREMLLEYALKADYALLRGYKADKLGNLIYRGTQRHHQTLMAAAARITIVEVDEIVEVGDLDPESIITPGVYVNRIIKTPKDNCYPRHLERNFWVKNISKRLSNSHSMTKHGIGL